jgi:hypothetical protein
VLFTPNAIKSSGIISNLSQKISNINWILDSGATDHLTENKNLLFNYKHVEDKQFAIIANGDKMEILGSGSINIFSKTISNVLHVSNYASNHF